MSKRFWVFFAALILVLVFFDYTHWKVRTGVSLQYTDHVQQEINNVRDLIDDYTADRDEWTRSLVEDTLDANTRLKLRLDIGQQERQLTHLHGRLSRLEEGHPTP